MDASTKDSLFSRTPHTSENKLNLIRADRVSRLWPDRFANRRIKCQKVGRSTGGQMYPATHSVSISGKTPIKCL